MLVKIMLTLKFTLNCIILYLQPKKKLELLDICVPFVLRINCNIQFVTNVVSHEPFRPIILISYSLRAQSFTSLKADLHQYIMEVLHLGDALMEHFLEGRSTLLVLW